MIQTLFSSYPTQKSEKFPPPNNSIELNLEHLKCSIITLGWRVRATSNKGKIKGRFSTSILLLFPSSGRKFIFWGVMLSANLKV